MISPHRTRSAKRRKKPASNLSYGLFESACNAVGISMLGWFPPERRRPASKIAAKMRRGPWGKK